MNSEQKQFSAQPFYTDYLRSSLGAALGVAPRPSVCPNRASDFLEIGKTIETSNLVE